MGCPFDGGENIKIEKNIMPFVIGGFVVHIFIYQNRLQFKVKRLTLKGN